MGMFVTACGVTDTLNEERRKTTRTEPATEIVDPAVESPWAVLFTRWFRL